MNWRFLITKEKPHPQEKPTTSIPIRGILTAKHLQQPNENFEVSIEDANGNGCSTPCWILATFQNCKKTNPTRIQSTSNIKLDKI